MAINPVLEASVGVMSVAANSRGARPSATLVPLLNLISLALSSVNKNLSSIFCIVDNNRGKE